MDTVKVNRALLQSLYDGIDDYWSDHQGAEAYAELRALLAEQPQAGAGQEAPPCWWINHGSHGQITQREDEAQSAANEGKQVVRYTASAQPAARQEQGDEVRRLQEAFKQAEKNERHGNNAETRYWCDQYKQLAKAALTHSQQGAKE